MDLGHRKAISNYVKRSYHLRHLSGGIKTINIHNSNGCKYPYLEKILMQGIDLLDQYFPWKRAWLGGATVARLTPVQKVACSNHVRVTCFV